MISTVTESDSIAWIVRSQFIVTPSASAASFSAAWAGIWSSVRR